MKTLLACLLLLPELTLAYPRISSARGCNVLWDVALVARALAANDVPKPQAISVMADIYSTQDEFGQIYVKALTDKAYADKREARQFAREFLETCMRNEGNVSSFFGADV